MRRLFRSRNLWPYQLPYLPEDPTSVGGSVKRFFQACQAAEGENLMCSMLASEEQRLRPRNIVEINEILSNRLNGQRGLGHILLLGDLGSRKQPETCQVRPLFSPTKDTSRKGKAGRALTCIVLIWERTFPGVVLLHTSRFHILASLDQYWVFEPTAFNAEIWASQKGKITVMGCVESFLYLISLQTNPASALLYLEVDQRHRRQTLVPFRACTLICRRGFYIV
ncbi:hypothetical protein B0T13DRAFT_204615 [Neurospora crassa]|nr:hypothetical protein B0T13DRAFT_204615 [Neurospora crassa]